MALFGRKKKEKEVAEKPQEGVIGGVAPVDKPAVPVPTSDNAYAYQVVVKPHLTEKASLAGALNKYVFRVSPGANKIEVKSAVEKLYKVKVKKVAVISIPAKERRLGRQIGFRAGYKKAVVTLAEGEKIEIAA